MTTDIFYFFLRRPVDFYCSNTANMHYLYLLKPNKPVECLSNWRMSPAAAVPSFSRHSQSLRNALYLFGDVSVVDIILLCALQYFTCTSCSLYFRACILQSTVGTVCVI